MELKNLKSLDDLLSTESSKLISISSVNVLTEPPRLSTKVSKPYLFHLLIYPVILGEIYQVYIIFPLYEYLDIS
ncbi:hypothetical protein NE686_00975 [Tissierella carlieri]|uniref:Uncharacterized protein n=1 Tax=Tissierella carlieri TaxID=689904 RepID=A0ABT1S5A7_9FIRM|nr:hypothetical protein [Tissierella carlieri]